MKLYSELAEYYYEIEKPGRKFIQEIRFLDSVFKKHRIKTILDLGCGTGEHVQAMQGLGYSLIGVDLSQEMINYAKLRFPTSQFSVADMQSYSYPNHFDGIYCLFGTFNYLLEEHSIQNSFDSIRRNLKNSGLFILEIWNAIPFQLIKRKPITTVSQTNYKGLIIQRNRGFKLKTIEQSQISPTLVEVNYIYMLDKKEVKDRHLMRVFNLDDMSELVKKNRFEILHLFGNYQGEKYSQYSSRMIMVLQKK